jgi:hypothetical protein
MKANRKDSEMLKKIGLVAALAAGGLMVGGQEPAQAISRDEWCPRGTMTVSYGAAPICAMRDGQRLDVVFSRRFAPPRHRQAWGGDASLAWAHRECLRYGGEPRWHNGTWMRCADVDR